LALLRFRWLLLAILRAMALLLALLVMLKFTRPPRSTSLPTWSSATYLVAVHGGKRGREQWFSSAKP
jgi:hypothetical protein